MVKCIVVAFLILALGSSAAWARGGAVRVRSSYTKTGSYRPAYVRTAPNKTKIDNWSAKGNYNPYTGKSGTKNP